MANNPCGGVPQPHAFEHAFKGATLFECTPYAGLMMLHSFRTSAGIDPARVPSARTAGEREPTCRRGEQPMSVYVTTDIPADLADDAL